MQTFSPPPDRARGQSVWRRQQRVRRADSVGEVISRAACASASEVVTGAWHVWFWQAQAAGLLALHGLHGLPAEVAAAQSLASEQGRVGQEAFVGGAEQGLVQFAVGVVASEDDLLVIVLQQVESDDHRWARRRRCCVRVPWNSLSKFCGAWCWKILLAVSERERTRFSAPSEFGEGSAPS